MIRGLRFHVSLYRSTYHRDRDGVAVQFRVVKFRHASIAVVEAAKFDQGVPLVTLPQKDGAAQHLQKQITRRVSR